MKQTANKSVKRPARPGAAARAKHSVLARRPLHKRVLLHPFTVMVLLCAGVLIIGTALRSLAAPALDVTATVPASIPGSPATIITPGTAQHFSTPQATVTGACPAQTYVKLYRNTLFSGTAQCSSSSYQIQTSLADGPNELTAQVYNLTDQAGPTGTPVVVYYDQITQDPPATPREVPTTMWVANVDSGAFKEGSVARTSDNPTVAGWAPPWSMLTVTFHSDPRTCSTQASEVGWWSCTLDGTLPAGKHHVDVTAVTAEGHTLSFPTFQITVLDTLPSLLVPPAANVEQLLVRADYYYQVHLGHQSTNLTAGVTGGTPPYAIATDWGDGTTTTLTRTSTSPFTVSHTYPTPAGPNKDYAVLVKATDARGEIALMQLSVVVKGNGIVLLASNTTLGALLDGVHRWLWLIWPAYVIVVLMAVGYYLGEREEYRHLMVKKRTMHIGSRTK